MFVNLFLKLQSVLVGSFGGEGSSCQLESPSPIARDRLRRETGACTHPCRSSKYFKQLIFKLFRCIISKRVYYACAFQKWCCSSLFRFSKMPFKSDVVQVGKANWRLDWAMKLNFFDVVNNEMSVD